MKPEYSLSKVALHRNLNLRLKEAAEELLKTRKELSKAKVETEKYLKKLKTIEKKYLFLGETNTTTLADLLLKNNIHFES